MLINMRNLNIHKFGFVLILALLMSFYPAKALGVTRPILERESLLRGENTKFYFQIQATGSSSKLSCSYSTPNLDPLVISFDEPSAEVNINEIKYIHGTVTVPNDAPIKTYSGAMFSVSCEPIGAGGEGSVIKPVTTIYFPSVNVVEKLESTVSTIPIEEKAPATSYSSTIFILIIVIIVIIIGYFFKKEKKKK